MGDPEWWKIVKARKDHICLICKKPIKKGTEYVLISGIERKGTEFDVLISGIVRKGFVNKKMHVECECNFDDYLAHLDEDVEIAETYSVAGEDEEVIDINRVYKDEEDGIIKIMDKEV